MAKLKGSRKTGRSKRRPSGAQQAMRTARNKSRRLVKAGKRRDYWRSEAGQARKVEKAKARAQRAGKE